MAETNLLKVLCRASVGVRSLNDTDIDSSILVLRPVLSFHRQPRLLHEIDQEPSRQRRLLVSVQQPEPSGVLVKVVEDDSVRISIERARQPTGGEGRRVGGRRLTFRDAGGCDDRGRRGGEEDGRKLLVGFDVIGAGGGVEEGGLVNGGRNRDEGDGGGFEGIGGEERHERGEAGSSDAVRAVDEDGMGDGGLVVLLMSNGASRERGQP
jgi:hypothetical protein